MDESNIWQPFDTAPKDGTIILAAPWPGSSSGMAKIFWFEDSEYDEFKGVDRKWAQWLYDDYSQDDIRDSNWEPEFWRHLPELPIQLKGNKNT
jgi:hypothetical protein